MLFKRYLKKDVTLIINVDNFLIEAAIFNPNENGSPKILQILETVNLIQDELNPVLNFKDLEQKIKWAFQKIVERAHLLKKRIDFVLIILSSPWFTLEIHHVKIKKESSSIFTKSDLDKILKDENSSFLKKIKDGSFGQNLQFIEADIMKVLLNGYETSSPFGKESKTVELYLYLSALKKSFFDFLDDLAASRLNLSLGKNIIIKTRPSLFFDELKDSIDFQKGAIIADIGVGITEMMLIENNYIKETASFAKGYDFFIWRLRNGLNYSFAEAESSFMRYQENSLEPNFQNKVSGILENSKKDWQALLKGTLNELEKDYFLPKDLFFFSAKPVSREFFFSHLIEKFSIQNLFFHKIAGSYLKAPDEELKKYSPFLLLGLIFLTKGKK